MTDEAPRPMAYQQDAVEKAAHLTISHVLQDVMLRKWCVEQSVRHQDMTALEIYQFVIKPAIAILKDLGYIVNPEAKPDTPS